MSFQPSGQAAPFNEEQLSQQQPTLLASGGAWVLTGDLSGAQQCPLQSLHHLKNPAQGPSPERCSIVSGLGARFSSLCDTILLFILSGRSLSPSLSPPVAPCRCVTPMMEGTVWSMADGFSDKKKRQSLPSKILQSYSKTH